MVNITCLSSVSNKKMKDSDELTKIYILTVIFETQTFSNLVKFYWLSINTFLSFYAIMELNQHPLECVV